VPVLEPKVEPSSEAKDVAKADAVEEEPEPEPVPDEEIQTSAPAENGHAVGEAEPSTEAEAKEPVPA